MEQASGSVMTVPLSKATDGGLYSYCVVCKQKSYSLLGPKS